jgi:Mn-dependent transcriptional regulator
MAKGAAYETSYCRRGLFGGRAYTSKEARYGAFGGCCPVHGGFKTQRMLRSRDFTGGRFLTMDEKHYLHLTELGRDAAEKIYERHCFLTKYLISIGVAPATAEADACRIEHDISAETYERLKELVTKE